MVSKKEGSDELRELPFRSRCVRARLHQRWRLQLPAGTGEHHLLVDGGAGDLGEHAATLFPSVDHSTTVKGKLLENLRATGIEPSDIDTVVITHAHPDHVGGTLDEAGNLVSENARYFVSREEWDFCSAGSNL